MRIKLSSIPARLERVDALLALATSYRDALVNTQKLADKGGAKPSSVSVQSLSNKDSPMQKPLTRQQKSAVFNAVVECLTNAGVSRDEAFSRALGGGKATPGEAQEAEVQQIMKDRGISRDEAFTLVMRGNR